MPIMGKLVHIQLAILFYICNSISGVAAETGWLQKGQDLLGDVAKEGTDQNKLTNEEIGAGLKETLRTGTATVVKQLGKPGGFSDDPEIHIPLPESLNTVKSTLSKVGMEATLEDLELRLNRAAEAATPKAKKLFADAISAMTLDDVKAIYKGPDDAATQYFRDKMSPALHKEMQPIVAQSLADVGAIQTYDKAMEQYRSIPFVPDVKADLTRYVVEKGSDGIFHYLAVQEAQIRTDPAKQTTDLLKRLYGSSK